MNDRKIVVIAGPTAVGKTAYAIDYAMKNNGEIVSCDSMQLYKYMKIGTAKPTDEELNMVPHHLIGVVDPRDEFSVATYQKMAKEAIEEILSRGKLPVIAGGTGLYLNSLLYDMDFGKGPKDESLRDDLFKLAETEGNEAVHQILREKDPSAAERIHPNNVRRVIRAIESVDVFGEKLKPFSMVSNKTKDYETQLFGLNRPREILYDRINQRVDIMMEEGLLDEVKELMSMGFTLNDIAMKGIGYKELIEHLDGNYDLETAVELIKRNTRHYAKRQITWFKRYDDMNWIEL